jgi:heme-degrading monooxygenase HmoA
MFVRMTELETDKKAMDQNIQYVNDQVVPTLQKSPASGFKGAYWLADRDAGKLMVFTLWESEQAMRASEDTIKQAREQSGQNGEDGIKQKGSTRYEVVAVAATPGVGMQGAGTQGGATR